MCGRYYSRYSKQQLAENLRTRVGFAISANYNVAPATCQPVVRFDSEGVPEAVVMRWGLVPYWSKDAKSAHSMINTKAETVATGPVSRGAFKARRALVPASGFFEWKKLDARSKQPYAIILTGGEIFAFAGLWDRWRDPATEQDLETFTIITTEPNELVAEVHSRMPVILNPADYDRWLDNSHRVDLVAAFKPAFEWTA